MNHLPPELLHERLPGISETAKIFANVDVTKGIGVVSDERACPSRSNGALQYGGSPDELQDRGAENGERWERSPDPGIWFGINL